jgi:hypothetical protein
MRDGHIEVDEPNAQPRPTHEASSAFVSALNTLLSEAVQ